MDRSNQYLLELQQELPQTFDSFVVGDNEEAFRVLKGVLSGQGPQFIYIHGPVGCGITHLLRSLVPAEPFRVPRFTPERTLYTVDNVDELDPGWCQQLLTLQNEIHRHANCRLVCGGKRPIAQMTLPESVKSRLSWGVSYAISPLNEKDRFKEILRIAQARGFNMTREMQIWMALHLPRDMRTLMMILEEADRLALRRHRRLTLPLLRECVEQLEAQYGPLVRNEG